MNNGQIYDFVNTILRKEKEGSAVSPERFTLLLIESMWEKANFEYALFEKSQIITDTLKSLKRIETPTLVAGELDLTTLTEEYFHPTTAYYLNAARNRKIDIVTDAEWTSYLTSSLEVPTAEFPIAKLAEDTMIFYPLTNETVTLTYLMKPPEPFFDYYLDANDKVVYLTEGQIYTLLTDEFYVEKEAPYSFLGVGDTIGVKPAQDANNMSKELPFPDNDRVDIAYKILQKFGIPVQEQMAVEYGMNKESKEQVL